MNNLTVNRQYKRMHKRKSKNRDTLFTLYTLIVIISFRKSGLNHVRISEKLGIPYRYYHRKIRLCKELGIYKLVQDYMKVMNNIDNMNRE